MFKVGYEEGDFKGMEAAGSTEEKARKNLKNKILRKLKKEIIESFTSTDIEHLYRCFETTTDDRDEVNNTIDTTGHYFGFSNIKDIDQMSHKLLQLEDIIKQQEQNNA